MRPEIHLDAGERKQHPGSESRSCRNSTRYPSNVGASNVQQHFFFGRNGNNRLYYTAQSNIPVNGTGISRYDFAQATRGRKASVSHNEAFTPTPSGFWSFFALIESASKQSAKAFADNLVLAVAGALADLYSKFHEQSHLTVSASPTDEEIQTTLSATLAQLEEELSANSCGAVTPSASEPGNLVLFYDSKARQLHASSTTSGLKAVLGRRTQSSVEQSPWDTMPLISGSASTILRSSPSVSGAGDNATRMASDHSSVSLAASSVSILPGDFLVVGSTSLWSKLSDDQVVKTVARHQTQQGASLSRISQDMIPWIPSSTPSPEGFFRPITELISRPLSTANAAESLIHHALHSSKSDTREGVQATLDSRQQSQHVVGDDITALIIYFSDDSAES
ncbi:hypothetical protein EIP91_006783 [Steccherinum ochraceum]|uniref:PPM-type phosphatase domain-containing protein n=1 Tax=Steccherinum ochraceum TaxID=92696 RepID=A0A4R0RDI4_9APHY|nr:hypothetical protein EIP91_006783 [Steccherinum ochraceum]